MTSLYWPYWLAHYYSVLEVATIVVGLIILVSSLDDLFIDIWYWSGGCTASSPPNAATGH